MTDPNDVISEPPAAPTGAEPQPSPAPGGAPPGTEDEPKEPSGNDELKAFMEEYRADKRAAAEKAAADAEAAAAAEAKKKKVPAPEPKKKAVVKVEPESPKANPRPEDRAYGSARYFNRKPKRVKE